MTEATAVHEPLYFNGIQGDTGEYALSPMSAEGLLKLLRGVAAPANLNELKRRAEMESERCLGVVDGVDPTKIAEAGWGVIFPADGDGRFVPGVKAALQPLLDLRREQAGKFFRIYEGVDALRPGESKVDFLVRHKVPPADPANPERMPYYLLLVGDPDQIPSRFQSQLDVQYAVGRIYFATLEEYANYARSVVAAERGEVQLARRAVLFGPANQDDPATNLSATKLIQPLQAKLQPVAGWQIETHLGAAATKHQLTQLLGGDATPALLFTASHGMDFSAGSDRQLHHQGALLCQDWPGPQAWRGRGPIPQDFYFAGDDLPSSANLSGAIAFCFACFGGGTPQYDDFPSPGTTQLRQLAPRPFVANLPMRLLGQANGGMLATIAHIERAWGTSFQWGRAVEQIDVFASVFTHLMAGNPVGSALEHFNSRYATWASDLSTIRLDMDHGLQVEPYNIANMWTAHNDARGYALIGDPAVRLPLLPAGQVATKRVAFTEPVTIATIGAGAVPVNAAPVASSTVTMGPTNSPAAAFGGATAGLSIPLPADFAIRVDFPKNADSGRDSEATDSLGERSQNAIRAAMQTIQAMAVQSDQMRKALPMDSQPNRINLKFGITLDSAAGALIAQSGIGATLEVELEWKR
jgi:hypothetical protein